MYALLLTLALTPDVPVANHKAASGCVGTPAKAAAGCYGSVRLAPAASCYGGSHVYRTPVRNLLRKPHGVTTYYAPAAVYVPTATVFQSAAPPVFRTPVRSTAAAVVCPGGRCPR